jgi:hypothetical protein
VDDEGHLVKHLVAVRDHVVRPDVADDLQDPGAGDGYGGEHVHDAAVDDECVGHGRYHRADGWDGDDDDERPRV